MIYGQRVQQLRVMHAMTQAELADRLLIQQSTLSRIEKGQVACDEETAAMLAVELGVADEYLTRQPAAPLEAHSPQFRSRSKVTQRDRGAAMQWAGLINEEFQRLMVAATPIPPRLVRAPNSDPTEAAHQMREQLGFTQSEPLPYLVLAVERLGARILGLPLMLPTMDAFSAWDCDTPVIGLLSGVPADRLRFSVAHELGHLVMHRPGQSGVNIEAEADAFAAELLTPRCSIVKWLPKKPTLNNLTMVKTQWGVSIKALVRRALELEVIDADRSLSLHKQISKRGWNRTEPGFVPTEKPRAFRKLAEISYGSGPNLTRMARGAGWAEETLMQVLAEHATSDELPQRATHPSRSKLNNIDMTLRTDDNVVYLQSKTDRQRPNPPSLSINESPPTEENSAMGPADRAALRGSLTKIWSEISPKARDAADQATTRSGQLTEEKSVSTRTTSDSVLAGRVSCLIDGGLPTVANVDLLELGVKPAMDTESEADLPPFVPRDRNDDLAQAIVEGGMVLLHGPAASGKSRVAAEVIRRLRPLHSLIMPRDGIALRDLVDYGFEFAQTVVWLDDFERFLTPGGLDLGLLHRLCRHGDGTVVVATMRDEELAQYDLASTAVSGRMTSIARDSVELIAQIRGRRRISLNPQLSTAEREAAAKQHDHRIHAALKTQEGFGEYLAAGQAMIGRWSTGDGQLFHVGQAIISAAVDCRRAGYHQPVPEAVLLALHREFLAPGSRDRADLPPASDGIRWACRRVMGASSCLQPCPSNTYLAADYLLDRAKTGDTPLARTAVSASTWHAVLALATPAEAVEIGIEAHGARNRSAAETAFRAAAAAGHNTAMRNLGILLRERGEIHEAEVWFRHSADSGDAAAMTALAALLEARGEAEDAEAWYHHASTISLPIRTDLKSHPRRSLTRSADADEDRATGAP